MGHTVNADELDRVRRIVARSYVELWKADLI
jgi:hypothetical protein